MKLKDFFQEEPVEFGSNQGTVAFYFRNPTAEEETEFLRRTSKQRIKPNGQFESTEVSLQATLWLYNKLLKKITIANGAAVEDVPREEYGDVLEQTRREAIAKFRNRIKEKDSDDLPGLTTELDKQLGLKGKLVERCPYGAPPAIDVQSAEDWMINDVPRRDADPTLCSLIISAPDACISCSLNVHPEPLSEYLAYICELAEIISAGARLNLRWGEWKALALLKRKYQEAELKQMKERNKT